MREEKNIKDFLDRKVREYNTRDFIKDDPVLIPHMFSKKQDQEISAFLQQYLRGGTGPPSLKSRKN